MQHKLKGCFYLYAWVKNVDFGHKFVSVMHMYNLFLKFDVTDLDIWRSYWWHAFVTR
jgi:hypothetical protein